jgi:hypothetical protein
LILSGFTEARYPGDEELVRSSGCEPAEVAALFRGRTDWREIAPDYLDRAGAASPSALSFFSAAAFRFYLPAFLVADLDGMLLYTDPLFYLWHGLDEATRGGRVRVQGEGMRSWWEVQQAHFADFTSQEAAAIVAYLRWKLDVGELTDSERSSVTEALESYWLGRTAQGSA